MNKVLILLLSAVISFPVFSASLPDLSSIADAEKAEEERREKARLALELARKAEQAAEQARQDRAAAAVLAERRRDQRYKDKLRNLQVRQLEIELQHQSNEKLDYQRRVRELELKEREALTASKLERAADYIDVELANKKARVAQQQARADAIRLEAEKPIKVEVEVKKESRWWE